MSQKLLKSLFGFAGSFGFIALGVYLLNTNKTTLGQIAGYANIVLFGGLILWASYKILIRKESNK